MWHGCSNSLHGFSNRWYGFSNSLHGFSNRWYGFSNSLHGSSNRWYRFSNPFALFCQARRFPFITFLAMFSYHFHGFIEIFP